MKFFAIRILIDRHLVLPFIRTAKGYSRRWLIIFDLRLEITFFAVHNNLKRKADTNRWLFIRFLTHKKEHREPLPNAVNSQVPHFQGPKDKKKFLLPLWPFWPIV
ncbi:hypothetical protein ACJX0J_002911, partial [Zea mays]